MSKVWTNRIDRWNSFKVGYADGVNNVNPRFNNRHYFDGYAKGRIAAAKATSDITDERILAMGNLTQDEQFDCVDNMDTRI